MQIEPHVVIRNVPQEDEVRAEALEMLAELERFHHRITGARVVVEAPHAHHRTGNLYHVLVEIHVPGREIVVRRAPAPKRANEDVHVALRDAFHAARRQLEDFARERRGDVKSHEPPPEGRVVRLFPEQGFGFIRTGDGREFYFHRNSVLAAEFAALRVGCRVAFVEEAGDEGPQAASVRFLGGAEAPVS